MENAGHVSAPSRGHSSFTGFAFRIEARTPGLRWLRSRSPSWGHIALAFLGFAPTRAVLASPRGRRMQFAFLDQVRTRQEAHGLPIRARAATCRRG